MSVVFLIVKYSKYFDDFTCWFSGERSLLFRLLDIRGKENLANGGGGRTFLNLLVELAGTKDMHTTYVG